MCQPSRHQCHTSRKRGAVIQSVFFFPHTRLDHQCTFGQCLLITNRSVMLQDTWLQCWWLCRCWNHIMCLCEVESDVVHYTWRHWSWSEPEGGACIVYQMVSGGNSDVSHPEELMLSVDRLCFIWMFSIWNGYHSNGKGSQTCFCIGNKYNSNIIVCLQFIKKH